MATDGPTPKPCDSEIFEKGEGLCTLDGSSNLVENWVRAIAKEAHARIDWHYSGGRANVLHLGDAASRERALRAIEKLRPEFKGDILSINGPALYRAGDSVPEGVLAVDPGAAPFVRAFAHARA